MCGRFTTTTPAAALATLFSVDEVVDPDPGPRWNVAPTDEVWAVARPAGRRRMRRLRWGLVPPWAPDPSGASRMINARAETVADKPAFREAFARRRCLVPADGFYEWRRGSGRPQPFYLHSADGGPLAFAGLYETWRDPADEAASVLRTCTIVTTEANATVAPLHGRMPVVLAPAAWDEWLDPGVRDVPRLRRLLVPAPDGVLAVRAVAPLVNDVRRDGPELVEPAPGTAAGPVADGAGEAGRGERRAR